MGFKRPLVQIQSLGPSEKTEIVLISVFFVVSEAERRVFGIIYSLFMDCGGKIML